MEITWQHHESITALILTNHLADFGGSEIVAVEVAEALKSAGCRVHLLANFIDNPMKSCMDASGLSYGADPPFPDPFEHDIVWSQHHVLSLILSKIELPQTWRTYFVSCNLSPFDPLEGPGWAHELADLVFANSPETAESMERHGIDSGRLSIFYNAAPSRFIVEAPRPTALRCIMLVGNDIPEEVRLAAELARENGVEVLHIGRFGSVERLTPEHFCHVDAVVTIGKTVQYCVLTGCPVYIYGKFGGPGWLTQLNLEAAESKNFSGRCCGRKLTGEQLWSEWMGSYRDGLASINLIKASRLSRFRLEDYLDEILKAATVKRHSLRPTSLAKPDELLRCRAREGRLVDAIRHYYRGEQTALRASRDLLSELRTELNQRDLMIEELRHSISWRITAPLRTVWAWILRVSLNTRRVLKWLGIL